MHPFLSFQISRFFILSFRHAVPLWTSSTVPVLRVLRRNLSFSLSLITVSYPFVRPSSPDCARSTRDVCLFIPQGFNISKQPSFFLLFRLRSSFVLTALHCSRLFFFISIRRPLSFHISHLPPYPLFFSSSRHSTQHKVLTELLGIFSLLFLHFSHSCSAVTNGLLGWLVGGGGGGGGGGRLTSAYHPNGHSEVHSLESECWTTKLGNPKRNKNEV